MLFRTVWVTENASVCARKELVMMIDAPFVDVEYRDSEGGSGLEIANFDGILMNQGLYLFLMSSPELNFDSGVRVASYLVERCYDPRARLDVMNSDLDLLSVTPPCTSSLEGRRSLLRSDQIYRRTRMDTGLLWKFLEKSNHDHDFGWWSGWVYRLRSSDQDLHSSCV
jgi:hypothetical protein